MEPLENAINDVLSNYSNLSPRRIDMDLFASFCTAEIKNLNLPFYKFYINPDEPKEINIDVPFLKSCKLKIKSTEFSEQEYCILEIDGTEVRKIKIESYEPNYLRKLAFAILDWFKRFSLFKIKS